ncbi:Abc transporter c family member 5, partial [Globisporangium splendens]
MRELHSPSQINSPRTQEGYHKLESQPVRHGSFFSWIVFSFANPLLKLGNTRQLNMDDLQLGRQRDMEFNLEALRIRLAGSVKVPGSTKAVRETLKEKTARKTWTSPTVVVYMLYAVIDVAAFAGLGVIALSMAAGILIAALTGQAFGSIMMRKDERMKSVKEVFGAIQIVKFNAWEDKFAEKIRKLRALELKAVAKFAYLNALNVFLMWSSPIVVSAVSFAVYSLAMDKPLTASKVFTSIALFNAIRDPLRAMPQAIQSCIQAGVSLNRVATFLKLEDFEPTNVTKEDPSQPNDVIVSVQDGSFGWSKDTPLLKDVNFSVKKGDLVVVHGSVGAGKSSLCSALLGEMGKLSGSVFVRGRVAYYSQQTWIQNMTIRDNILFGNQFELIKYQRVLEVCRLLPDLAQFPGGDATEIGEKGINLSGGQKARLCLARACYSDADLIILDSPLAAVDAVVQSEIFSECICGLLADKTVILVTHSPDIIASDAANYKIQVEDGVLSGERREPEKHRSWYASKLIANTPVEAREPESDATKQVNTEAGRMIIEEERHDGRVSKSVFASYFRATGGITICSVLLFVQSLWQGFQVASDFWLSHWVSENKKAYDASETGHYMTIYSLLGAGGALMVLSRAVIVAFLGLRASRKLFDSMTHSLLSAPLKFFDANPIGRVVNRYGEDMSAVDFSVPGSFGSTLAFLFFTVVQLGTAIYTVQYFGFIVIPLVYIYIKISMYFLAPSREVARLLKVSASPVLSHINESEQGVVHIRAFGDAYVERAIDENFKRIDVSSRAWFVFSVGRQWFQVRMQLIGCGIIILIVSSLVYLRNQLSPGVVGLAFSYALSVDGSISMLVQMYSWLEISMVSPERVSEYAAILPEGVGSKLVIEPSADWPRQGSIQFEDVVFSYKEGAVPVLKGLSFEIKNNEKIGIVGRTGAGKSSLTMALFRINELDSGRIVIDGHDVAAIPLRSLRSKLSIIPQAPVLFKGTLRAYMDPFDEYTDAEIWNAFEKVEMKEQISALENQLLYELSENGENFSVGERQLFCMARALLAKTRIVVMDEATASIDHTAEKRLQTMIERDLKDATVLTIAHRLATVLNSDRIMVLSDGVVVEFDTPRNLVKNPDGVFYGLAKEGGYLDRLLEE